MDPIRKKVESIRRKLWIRSFLARFCRGVFLGSAGICLLIVLHRLFSPGFSLAIPAAIILGLSAAVPLVLTALHRPSLLEAAVVADLANGLRERLSSCIALGGEAHPLGDRLRRDAESVLERVTAPIPFRPPLEGRLLFAPVLSAFLLFALMPDLDILHMAEEARAKRREKEKVSRNAERLLRRSRSLAKEASEKHLGRGLKVAKEVEKLSRELKVEKVDKKKAMVELSKLTDKVRKMSRSKEYEPVGKAFQPKRNMAVAPKSLSEKMLKAMKKGGRSEAARELRRQLEKFQEQVRQDQLSEEERNEMSKQLDRLRRNFEIPPDLAKKLEKLSSLLQKMKRPGQKEGDRKREYEQMEMDLEDMKKALEELAKRMDEKEFLEKLLKQLENAKGGMGGRKIPLPGKGGGKKKDDGQSGPGQGRNPGTGKKPGEDGTGDVGKGRGGRSPDGKDGDTDFKNTYLGGKFDLSGKIVGISSFKGLPSGSEAKAEYVELFSQFTKSAEDTLSREKIPVEYKDYIKRYFESIRPTKGEKD